MEIPKPYTKSYLILLAWEFSIRISAELPALLNLTIESASDGLNKEHFTSVDLINAYLTRIEETSEFKAVLQINPDAMTVAQHLDEERLRSGSRHPVHDIPILVKDNIVTKDKLDTSAGAYVLLGAKPSTESSLISKLQESGVIILGKTNLSGWANFLGLNISAGWRCPRGGQTVGVYYPNSRLDGSRSGSAVAAALGLCTAALGTETMGSIIDPAEVNNVVGFKPTRSLIATDGAIAISKCQDVIGTLTRTVKDSVYMPSNMAGRSELDNRTWNIPFKNIPDCTSFCKSIDLMRLATGAPRKFFDDNKEPASVMKSFESALNLLKSAGPNVVDNANFKAAEKFQELNQQVKYIVRPSKFKQDMVGYLRTLNTNLSNIQSVEDIINFTGTEPKEEYKDHDIGKFSWTQAEQIEADCGKYKEMVKQELYFGVEGGILGAIETCKLDVLVVPSTLGVANDLAAKMGFPVLSVLLGFSP